MNMQGDEATNDSCKSPVIGTLALFLSSTIQRGPGIEMLAAKDHWLLD